MENLAELAGEIRQCRLCAAHLPLGPRPVFVAEATARILVIGQAPGTKVHASGIPWDDASGKRLRLWMDLSAPQFYNSHDIAIVPMGFCYPGKGKSGDLPPRPECAPKWHQPLLAHLPKIELILLIGAYAIKHYLPDARASSLTEIVQNWRDCPAPFLPLPHPSPRNIAWFKRNPWFEAELVPTLQRRVREALS